MERNICHKDIECATDVIVECLIITVIRKYVYSNIFLLSVTGQKKIVCRSVGTETFGRGVGSEKVKVERSSWMRIFHRQT